MLTKENEIELRHLLFNVRRSVRYHSSRQNFFELLQKLTSLISVLFGSAVVVSAFAKVDSNIILLVALVVSFFSAIDLVIGNTTKAHQYFDLRRKFIELEKEIIGKSAPSTQDIKSWKQKCLDIEADEPPILKVLDILCHNEQVRADGEDEGEFVDVLFYQRWLSHFFDIQVHKLQKRKDMTWLN